MPASSTAGAGARGETIAALFLESRGYTVLGRNLRQGRREIDLLVERGATLVAVEVKWRRTGTWAGGAREAWSPAQRRRQAEALLLWLAARGDARPRACRFDLVTIDEDPRGLRLDHWPGAWAPAASWW
jgi:putative endonuclease